MRKSKMKSPKKKVIPHYFQKKNRSNTSLSKLLHIASYKKRINDLLYNNRRLARELQTARCEIADQNKMIEKNANEKNRMMFAKLKMMDMAKSITKLVADMDEVRHHLDFDLGINDVKFQTTRGFPCKKGFLVMPTVDCIEEVSVLSTSEHATSDGGSTPPPVLTRQSVVKPPINENGSSTAEVELHTDENCSVNSVPFPANVLPGIMFVEESGNPKVFSKQHKSSKKKSSDKQKNDHISLTPELDIPDIDFSCLPSKRSSSRRQTKLFKVSDSRKTKSKEKVDSPGPTLCPLIPCKTLDKDDVKTQGNTVLSPQDNKKEENLEISSILKDFAAKSVPIDDIIAFDVQPKSTLSKVPINTHDKLNRTVLLDEDMELTDIISTNPIFVSDGSVAVLNPVIASEIPSYTSKTDVSPKVKKSIKRKTSEISKMSPNVVKSSNPYVKVGNIPCDSPAKENEKILTCKNTQALLHDSLKSPSPPLIRQRKPLKYFVFSSSDSEGCETPKTSKSRNQKSSLDENRTTAIFIPKPMEEDCLDLSRTSLSASSVESCPELDNINKGSKKISVESGHNTTFDFNVSHSEEIVDPQDPDFLPKKAKLPKKRKPIKTQSPSKHLFRNCNVKKGNRFDYQFSKKKSSITSPKLSSVYKQTKAVESSSNKNACLSPGHSAFDFDSQTVNSLNQGTLSCAEEKDLTSFQKEYKCALKSSSTEETPKKQNILEMSVRSTPKRVSFATTDVVCNFKKMSLCKTIAANAKVKRTSKSAAVLENVSNEDIVKPLKMVDMYSKQMDNYLDCSFNVDEETEVYPVFSPTNAQCSEQKSMDLTPLKAASPINVLAEKIDMCDETANYKINLSKKNKKVLETEKVSCQKKLPKKSSSSPAIVQCSRQKNVNQPPLKLVSPSYVLSEKIAMCDETANYNIILKKNKKNKKTLETEKVSCQKKIRKKSSSSPANVQCSRQKNMNSPPLKLVSPICVLSEKIDMCDESASNKINLNKNKNTLETERASCQEKFMKKSSPVFIVSKSSKYLSPKVKNRSSKKKTPLNSKENSNLKNSETVKPVKKNKQQCSKSYISPVPHNRGSTKGLSVDDISKYRTLENTEPTEIIKNKFPCSKAVESSPVLKDVMNLGCPGSLNQKISDISNPRDEATIVLPKRRSKPVSYKEPLLNKKMRRN